MIENSRTCPIINECRDAMQGVAKGDFSKAVLNNGLLALYVVPVGGMAACTQAKVGL